MEEDTVTAFKNEVYWRNKGNVARWEADRECSYQDGIK